MRLKVISRMPTRWPKPRGTLLQCDLNINPGGRLLVKVFLFRTRRDMRAAWKRWSGQNLGRGCLAAVHQLRCDRTRFRDEGDLSWGEVDARYYCVMGFTERNLTTEVVAHESVHAAYAYAKRCARTRWDEAILDMDEEAVAYPAGLHTAGLMAMFEAQGYPVRQR